MEQQCNGQERIEHRDECMINGRYMRKNTARDVAEDEATARKHDTSYSISSRDSSTRLLEVNKICISFAYP